MREPDAHPAARTIEFPDGGSALLVQAGPRRPVASLLELLGLPHGVSCRLDGTIGPAAEPEPAREGD